MTGIWTMGEMLVEIMRPESGIPFYETGEFLGPFPSGAPAIFIDTAARLGMSAGMIGGVAEDDFGKCIIDRLVSNGVNVEYVERFPNCSTAVAFITYFEDGSREYIFHIDNTPAVMPTFNQDIAVEKPSFFHVMGCSLMANEQFRNEIIQAVGYFHANGARISFDPNIRVELLGDETLMEVIGAVMEKTAVLLPGESELQLISGESDMDLAAESLFDQSLLEVIVLKQGKEGAVIYTRDTRLKVPSFPVEEVDPTGAGDCFDAGFLVGILQGKSLQECGKIAAAAGALNTAAFGPMEGKISPDSIAELINRQPNRSEK